MLGEFEQFSFKGWNDETVYGYVVKPLGLRPRAEVSDRLHRARRTAGAASQNQWNWRWNAQAFAARGYGVVFIDFHGSPGYGQAFTDSISQHWGDRPFEDLQKGLAAALEKYPWLDGKRACSLGASYGGYMQNWIAGNWPDGFRCIVNHDGIFDTRSMYYTTEELWFTEWENGGPYFEHPEIHERFNPANHVTQWKTPMLVIHGEQDFRVPYAQGIATFTALQRRGIESRLVVFPDENHWVLKPANSIYWYGTCSAGWTRILGIARAVDAAAASGVDLVLHALVAQRRTAAAGIAERVQVFGQLDVAGARGSHVLGLQRRQQLGVLAHVRAIAPAA